MNRYTNISTGTFTPRSVKEIMAVPLAKHQQHIAAQNILDDLSLVSFNTLQGDMEISTKEIDAFRNKINDLTSNLAENGINANVSDELLSLKNEYNKNMSQTGKWGRRINNYKAAVEAKKDLFKYADKAGWSPEEAMLMYNKTLAGFKTDNGDGTYNTYQSINPPDKINYEKFIDDAIKDVASDIVGTDGKIHHIKDFDSFTELYSKQLIETKDYNKIMSAVAGQINNSQELAKSTLFKARLYGDNRDEKDILTHFSIEEGNDKNPATIKGIDEIGRYLQAKAGGASTVKDRSKYWTNQREDRLMAAKDAYSRNLARYKQSLEDISNGIHTSIGNGPQIHIFEGNKNIEEVNNIIQKLREEGDITKAQQYENILNDAKEEFYKKLDNKTKEDINNYAIKAKELFGTLDIDNDEILSIIAAEGKPVTLKNGKKVSLLINTVDDIKEGYNNVFVLKDINTGETISRIVGDKFKVFGKDKITKQLDEISSFYKLIQDKKDNFVTQGYSLNTKRVWFSPGKKEGQLSNYLNKTLTNLLTDGMNNFNIRDAYIVYKNSGKEERIDLKDGEAENADEKIKLLNQATLMGNKIDLVSFTRGEGYTDGEFMIKFKDVDGNTIKANIQLPNAFSGDILKVIRDSGDQYTKDMMDGFIEDYLYKNITPTKSFNEQQSNRLTPYISKDLNPTGEKQFSLNYKVNYNNGVKSKVYYISSYNKGNVSQLKWKDVMEVKDKGTEEQLNVSVEMLKAAGRKLYPSLPENEAYKKVTEKAKDSTFVLNLLEQPFETTDKNTAITLIK